MCIWRWRVSAARSTVFLSFALYKTSTKSHENYVFEYGHLLKIMRKKRRKKKHENAVFYTSKLYGLTGMMLGVCIPGTTLVPQLLQLRTMTKFSRFINKLYCVRFVAQINE